MHKAILFFFPLFFFSTHAQFKISTLQDVAPFERGTLEFPFLKAINTKTANSINALLQASVLDNSTVITDPHENFRNSKYINIGPARTAYTCC